jgi:hypothetical protein
MATIADGKPLRRILEGALVIMFALLVWNNASLRRRVSVAAAAPVSRHGFGVKDVIRTVPVKDLDGHARVLDLQTGRTVVAVVDPSCASCRDLVATMGALPSVQVLSLASAEATRPLAAKVRGTTSLLGDDARKEFHLYPQLFVVDHGLVVRTCAN